MKLFGYYVWHSFVNQLKKLFKTWVMAFVLVCFVLGCVFGFVAVTLTDSDIEDDTEITDGEVIEEDIVIEEESFLEASGIDLLEIVELVVGGIILTVFVFQIIGADKNGSKIFLPADVNLLFASPMKPQSVLLFRLMTQLGVILIASLYLLFQIPNLINLGVSIWAALAVIATWCFTIIMGKLLQLLLYTVCSTHAKLKSYLRKGTYAFLAVLAVAYFLYWKSSSLGYLKAAIGFFNSPASRFIPLWGWLKGFCMFAMEGNLLGVLLCFAAIVISGAIISYIIWHVKADFYEDAMAKSEEIAELLERAKSEKSGAVTVAKRNKDRSERLKRDGIRHGSGANMFFFKAMYNRFRFAHLGIFTKTSETYFVAAIGVSALCRFVFQTDGLIPVVLTLGGLAFFRALGNPLAQDTKMDYFLLIPESTWRKLFWSLMGGTANCFLDVLPAMVVAMILLGANPLVALAWIPFIVSIDFFATTVGTFIDISVPVSAGKMLKQLVQILFIYFGLLPDIVIMAVGLTLGEPIIAAIICAAINILLGLLFFSLTPLFLEPKDGKKYHTEKPFTGDLKIAKKHFSRLGIGTFSILLIGSVVQILIIGMMDFIHPEFLEHDWGMWLSTFAPLYLIAVPIGLLILRKVPAKPLAKQTIKPSQYLVLAIISIFMMYAGNIIGTILTTLLQSILGLSPENPVISFATETTLLPKILFMVILAPIIEEYIFRKQLIDRMHIYGEKLSVVTSALIFGLFHGNLSQLFYAFTLGLVFGYVYLKTGKLRYSIGLHMFINFLGSVIAPLFLEHLDLTALEIMDMTAIMSQLPWFIGYIAYAFVLLGLTITGLVLLCIKKRQISFNPAELELPRRMQFKTVYINVGMILLIALCIGSIILTL